MTKRVTLQAHTVKTAEGFVAGSLVRSIGGKALGYIWAVRRPLPGSHLTGTVWYWRAVNETAFGERATQAAAIDVLCDIANLREGPRLPFDGTPTPTDKDILSAWRSVTTKAAPVAKPKAAPVAQVAAKPEQRIVWNDSGPKFDVTAAIRNGLGKK